MRITSGIPTLNKTEVNNLLMMIDHSRRDMSYSAGGSFGDGDNFNAKEIRQVENAIETLKQIIVIFNR